MDNQAEMKTRPAKCPICKSPAAEAFRPFCSKRCAEGDLSRWLTGRYAIPGPPVAPPEREEDGEERD